MQVAGGGGGRTGPYWRRQLGTTLPGERTGADLNIINLLRAKQGLDPEGGPIGDTTRTIMEPPQVAQRLGRPAMPGQDHGRADLLRQAKMHLLRQAIPGADVSGQRDQLREDAGADPRIAELSGARSFEQGYDEDHNGMIGGGQISDLRQQLLNRFQGAAPMLTSRDALRRYVANQPGRVARPGVSRQPILPQRQPRRQANPRPY